MRKLDLSRLVLHAGAHDPDSTFCIMEAVAYIAGEEWSDHPACACPVISSFLRRCNDRCTAAQRLVQYIPRLVGSKATREVELRRAFKCADWTVRVIAPIRLRRLKRETHAQELEQLAPIVDHPTAYAAAAAATYAAAATAYTAAAAYAAAYAAATDTAAAAAAAATYAAAAYAAVTDTAADDDKINDLCHSLIEALLAIN